MHNRSGGGKGEAAKGPSPPASSCRGRHLRLKNKETGNIGPKVCHFHVRNAVVTCEIELFQNYFSLRRRMTEIIS